MAKHTKDTNIIKSLTEATYICIFDAKNTKQIKMKQIICYQTKNLKNVKTD